MTTTTKHIQVTEWLIPRHEDSSETPWSLGTRLAFRFCCAYALIEWVTMSVWLLTPTLTLGLLGRPNWYYALNASLGRWLVTHILNLPEHSPPRLSANDLPLFLGILTVAAISAAIALVWSALDRDRTSHPRLFALLHTSMRFLLAATMLWYGWAKVLPVQFVSILDRVVREVADLTPSDLLWAFMSGSRDYQIFTGSVEVAGGLFLLTRRTAMLGAVISMASMATVLVLNISYDVPVKFLAGQIFLMSLFVLAPFAIRFLSVFDLTRHVHATPARRLFRSESVDRTARIVGVVLGVWIVWTTLHSSLNSMARYKARQANVLLGIWDVEAISKNGSPVPLLITDATLGRRLVVYSNSEAIIFPMTRPAPPPQWTGKPATVWCDVQQDSTSQTMRFTPFPFLGASGPAEFAYALPDPDHLVLTQKQLETTHVIHLRRFDLSAYPLLNWERHWFW